MNSSIRQIDIKAFSSAIGVTDWTPDEFMVFEGAIPPPKWYTPLRQEYYPILCLQSGVIKNIVDLQPYELGRNDLLLLKPSQILQVESISADSTGKIIVIDEGFFVGEQGHLLEKLSIFSPMSSPVLSLTENEAEEISNGISNFKRKVEDVNKPHRRMIAINLISTLLLEIDAIYQTRHLQQDKVSPRKEMINCHFHNLLSRHFLHERTVMFYADLLNITPKYLTEITKEMTGKTAGELIDDRVILEAKVLLRNPDLAIKQVAEILHFSDQFFFSKYFKNFSGSSPSQYRELCEV